MFELSVRIPKKINICFNGGMDSQFAYHYLSNYDFDISLVFICDGTALSNTTEQYCRLFAKINKVKLYTVKWCLNIADTFAFGKENVVWCKNADDNKSIYLKTKCNLAPTFSSCGNIIYYPFLFITKKEIQEYCEQHNISYLTNPLRLNCHYEEIKTKLLPLAESLGVAL